MTKEKKAKEAKTPRGGIGSVIMDAMRAGKTNAEALELVQKKFPDSKATLSSVNWYRNKLRADGEKVPSGRELRAANTKPKEKKAKLVKAPLKSAKKPTFVKKPVKKTKKEEAF
jgi:hypothetical protein